MADNFAEMHRVAEELVRDSLPGLLRSTQHLDKEDLAQEALIRFLAVKNLTSIESPTAYLGQIFRHVVWERRKADARNAAFITTAYDPLESTVENGSAPAVAGPEAKLSVSQKSRPRSPVCRRRVGRGYVLKTLGLSYREISAELNLTHHRSRSTSARPSSTAGLSQGARRGGERTQRVAAAATSDRARNFTASAELGPLQADHRAGTLGRALRRPRRARLHDRPEGECWIAFADQPAFRMTAGDFLLLPSTPAFALSSHPGVDGVLREPTNAPVRHGDPEGEPDFESLGGAFRIERINAPLLLALLPRMILIPASEGRTDRLSAVIALIRDECASEEPGRDMILQRMLEVLLVEALRWRGVARDDDRAGLLNGLRDPVLARVLRAMHADVRGATGRSRASPRSRDCRARRSPRGSAASWAAARSNTWRAGAWRWPRTP